MFKSSGNLQGRKIMPMWKCQKLQFLKKALQAGSKCESVSPVREKLGMLKCNFTAALSDRWALSQVASHSKQASFDLHSARLSSTSAALNYETPPLPITVALQKPGWRHGDYVHFSYSQWFKCVCFKMQVDACLKCEVVTHQCIISIYTAQKN